MRTKKKIPFVNLGRKYRNIKNEIDSVLANVLRKGSFILGQQVDYFEKEFASYLGATYGVGVASGTDALLLSLRALGVGAGDEVLLPANSYPTAFAAAASGARLRLTDIDPHTFTMDPRLVERHITPLTKVIIPVHLYGQAANLDPILAIAKKHRLFVVEDACQAHGTTYKGKKAGTLGDIGCFSFYPTKNLGGFGDGGMVVTNNRKLATLIRELRMYGERLRYQSRRLGINSRLDEIQAAILRVKLKKLDRYNRFRQEIAALYRKYLKDTTIILPKENAWGNHIYHLFVIRTKKRNKLAQFLAAKGVETGIHFPLPIHLVKTFANLGYKKGDFAVTEEIVSEILSLPCYPELEKSQVKYIATLVKTFLN